MEKSFERPIDILPRALEVSVGKRMKLPRSRAVLEVTQLGLLVEKRQEETEEQLPLHPEFAPEKGYSCPLCLDYGLIPITIVQEHTGKAYTTNDRCCCAAGRAIPKKYADFRDDFGRYPTREEADWLRKNRADGRII